MAPTYEEQKAVLEQAIRAMGQGTVKMIIMAKKESGSEHFSKIEKEAIEKLF